MIDAMIENMKEGWQSVLGPGGAEQIRADTQKHYPRFARLGNRTSQNASETSAPRPTRRTGSARSPPGNGSEIGPHPISGSGTAGSTGFGKWIWYPDRSTRIRSCNLAKAVNAAAVRDHPAPLLE